MRYARFILPTLAAAALSTPAQAAFHMMQIEEVIGGVEGDPTAQAVMLRMRAGGQTVISATKLVAFDATGQNPITLLDMNTDVSKGNLGSEILFATAAFNTVMHNVPGYAADFTLANAIPVAYLNGGRLTFQSDSGTILWSVAFGNYTGSNTGDTTNDSDGNFGAATQALPTGTLRGVHFTGAASAASTNNLADYALTTNPATVTNDNGTTFTVVPEPGAIGLLAFGAASLGGLIYRRRQVRD